MGFLVLAHMCTVRGIWYGWDCEHCQFPHLVLIGVIADQFTNTHWTDIDWRCNGAIIQSKYVVTSASCLEQHTEFLIRFGTNKFPDHNKLKPLRPYIHRSKSGQKPFFAKGFVAGHVDNDSAVIEIAEEVTFDKCDQPVILSSNDSDLPGDLLVTGFVENKILDVDTPQYLAMRQLDDSDCLKSYPSADTNTTLCARGIDYNGSNRGSLCNEKAGVPLVLKEDNRTLVGIFSYSRPGCDIGGPEAFVEIGPHIDWMKNWIGIDN